MTLTPFPSHLSRPAVSYPAGARPLHADETSRRREIERRFLEVLESCGFREVTVPLIDFASAYDGVVPDELLRRSYRFIDREGEVVLLRSDFTPMLARLVAPSITDATRCERLCYRGEVIRADEGRSARDGAMFQIGAEIIGGDRDAADVEVLQLAGRLCRSLAIDATLILSDASLMRTIVGAAAPEEQPALRTALAAKRRCDVGAITRSLAPDVRAIAAAFIRGTVTLDELDGCSTTRPLARRLANIAARSKQAGLAVELALDAVDAAERYYTSLRFDLVTNREQRTIASGGRYDRLYGRFGTDAPAVGFTFDIDALERVE